MAILGAAFRGRVIGDRLALAFAYGVDAVAINTLADQVDFDRIGAARRQIHQALAHAIQAAIVPVLPKQRCALSHIQR
jgi:hypothetical protein